MVRTPEFLEETDCTEAEAGRGDRDEVQFRRVARTAASAVVTGSECSDTEKLGGRKSANQFFKFYFN